jgi:hypothetical protein
LGAEVLATEVLTPTIDRASYFSCAEPCGNLFLDPDTGLRLRRTPPRKSPEYVFAPELIDLVRKRPDALTLVFDQSLRRGSERLQVGEKLRHLRYHEVFGLAYVSHACFVMVGQDRELMDPASQRLSSESKLPQGRLQRIGYA